MDAFKYYFRCPDLELIEDREADTVVVFYMVF